MMDIVHTSTCVYITLELTIIGERSETFLRFTLFHIEIINGGLVILSIFLKLVGNQKYLYPLGMLN